MKALRETRKRIIAGDLDATTKRERLDEIDKRIAKVVSDIGAVRVKAGL
jgi:tetrahydromethanopterin S-methyltransferase subunit G